MNKDEEVKEIREPKIARPYLIYWHKYANSGLWGFDDLKIAENIAKEFASQIPLEAEGEN